MIDESAETGLGCTQNFIGSLALGNVFRKTGDPSSGAFLVIDGELTVANPAYRAVRMEEPVLRGGEYAAFALLPILEHRLPIVGVYPLEPFDWVHVEILASDSPKRFDAGTDVSNPVVLGVTDPENLVDVFRQLLEALLNLVQRRLRPPALVADNSPASSVQHFAQTADNRADQHRERQSDRGIEVFDLQGIMRFGKKVFRGEGAENRAQDPRRDPAVIGCDHDGRKEEHVRHDIAEHRPEKQPHDECHGCGEYSHAVSS